MLVIPFVLGACAPVGDEEPLARPSADGCVAPVPSRVEPAHPDLALVATVLEPVTRAGYRSLSEIVDAGIVHDGRGRRRPVVVCEHPGQGEPGPGVTAFVDEGDGCWKPAPQPGPPDCGTDSPDWTDSIVFVPPGHIQPLGALWDSPQFIAWPGRMRVFLHYRWSGFREAPEGGRAMRRLAEEPSYELISNAVELEVVLPGE